LDSAEELIAFLRLSISRGILHYRRRGKGRKRARGRKRWGTCTQRKQLLHYIGSQKPHSFCLLANNVEYIDHKQVPEMYMKYEKI